jgi:hypothetical protein
VEVAERAVTGPEKGCFLAGLRGAVWRGAEER